jgi:hypothetical protein
MRLTVNENPVAAVATKKGALGEYCDKGYDVRADTKEAPLPATSPKASDTPRP